MGVTVENFDAYLLYHSCNRSCDYIIITERVGLLEFSFCTEKTYGKPIVFCNEFFNIGVMVDKQYLPYIIRTKKDLKDFHEILIMENL